MADRCLLSLEEQYLFFKCALDDMKEARSFLRCIASQESRIVRSGLFTATVVAYMRPFQKSQIDKIRWYWIESDEIGFSSPEANLHEEYRKFRNKVFAHTDLLAMRACVRVTKSRPGRSRVHIGSVCVGRDPSRSDRIGLHGNINTVIEYLDQKLSDLHERFAA